MTRADTLHVIQDGDLDIPMAVTEAEATANALREALEQSQSRNEEDGSGHDDSVGFSDALYAPPLSRCLAVLFSRTFGPSSPSNHLLFHFLRLSCA